MDKSLSYSWTVWGAVIAGIGGILAAIGSSLQGGAALDWGKLLPQLVEIIGLVVAAIGGRRALGKMISNGKTGNGKTG